MKFWIISPSYRAKDFLHFHIGSVQAQTHKNFHHILILDGANAEEVNFINSIEGLHNFTFLTTEYAQGALNSHLLGIKKAFDLGMKKEDVIVQLDGDDWFFHPYVLAVIQDIYSRDNCWATYGNYISTDGHPSIARPVNTKISRKELHSWYFSHLRTFKCFLFEKIKPEDFRDDSGKIFKYAADVAMITPIIEMCPLDKIKFIPYTNVVYNRFWSAHEDIIDLPLQQKTGIVLGKRPPYPELTEKDL